METWIVLLRGINVGGKNRLPMKALREMLSARGYRNAQTYIQSGNCVVQSTQTNPAVISADIAAAIKAEFGYTIPVFALTQADIADVASEAFVLTDKVFYLHVPDGIGRSKLAARAEKLLGVSVTARNLRSVTKISALAHA